jgi:Flp pilus assembly protein TadD
VFEHVTKAVLNLATDTQVKGDPVKWKEYLDKLATAYSKDERVQYKLATYYLALGSFSRRLIIRRRQPLWSRISPPAYNVIGYSYEQLGDNSNAAFALCCC